MGKTIEPRRDMEQAVAGSGTKLPPRREYSLEFKRGIVEETFVPGASVSIVARRHDVNANLVFAWRKRYRERTLGPSKPTAKATQGSARDFIRIGVSEPDSGLCSLPAGGNSSTASATTPDSKPAHNFRASGAIIIEIELPNRVKLRVASSIEGADLRRLLLVSRQLP
jgi:transposase